MASYIIGSFELPSKYFRPINVSGIQNTTLPMHFAAESAEGIDIIDSLLSSGTNRNEERIPIIPQVESWFEPFIYYVAS